MENKRKQHNQVLAHKRKIRDEVNPQLRAAKRSWSDASKENKLKIKLMWHEQKCRVQGHQRQQKIKHKAQILAHKRRIKREMLNRR
ncbi:MAG: hypothetical protein HPY61_12155 [Methanotrichaceae archaeon]|nr:hypothetical protein [Methanotrichaceae archaeon]